MPIILARPLHSTPGGGTGTWVVVEVYTVRRGAAMTYASMERSNTALHKTGISDLNMKMIMKAVQHTFDTVAPGVGGRMERELRVRHD